MGTEKLKKTSVIWVCLMAALAGLLFGIDTGVIAQAKGFIKSDLNLTDFQLSIIVSSMLGGAAFGALSAGFITRNFGRKRSILVSSFLFCIGALGCTVATQANLLIVSRVLLGIAIGVASFVAPLYLSEVAPKKIRGTMISLYQLMITLGILVSFLSNWLVVSLTQTPEDPTGLIDFSISWRVMLGIPLIPATIFFIGTILLPESPRWLISVGRKDEAVSVLKRIRETETEAIDESNEIEETVKNSVRINGFKYLLQNRFFQKTVILGMILQISQQLTGINVIMYYGPEVIKSMGFDSNFAVNIGTVLIGLTNVLATFIAIYYIDKWGRKPILIVGYILMAISLVLVATFMKLNMGVFAITFILVFVISFAFSAGPIAWVLCAEVQPLAGRDFGVTCSTGANWISNMIVAAIVLSALNAFGNVIVMSFLAICCVASLFIVYFFCPETKGVSLEHLEKRLKEGVPLRKLGE